MFLKFLDAVSGPAQKVAEGAAKQIERQFQREADRAASRIAERAVKESSRKIVGLFSAIAPYEEDQPIDSAEPDRPRNVLRSGGIFAPPDE